MAANNDTNGEHVLKDIAEKIDRITQGESGLDRDGIMSALRPYTTGHSSYTDYEKPEQKDRKRKK